MSGELSDEAAGVGDYFRENTMQSMKHGSPAGPTMRPTVFNPPIGEAQKGFGWVSHRQWTLRILLQAVMVCLALLSQNAWLNAQEVGGFTGTVTDPSGAAIPGAHLTFTNTETGIVTQTATSSAGTYTATLTPGDYSLMVEAPGLEKYLQTHVVAEVGATPTINIQMQIGSSTETVQVTSDAIALNTTQPQLDTMLAPEEVSDLPLEIDNTIRQISSFATLAPGVRPGSYGSVTIEGGAPGQINSAGTYYNGLQLDTSSAVNSNPPYEMVDEFRVLRSTFSSRYGLVQGAVSYNMRSGTNDLHGDGFYINRNSVFDSAGFFPTAFNAAGKPAAPPDQESNYGGTIAGPVVLPKLYNGRNRTFFLGSVDLYSKDQAQTTIGTVPTPAMKTGDFSNFLNSSGQLIPIYDPTTGKPFPGNIIPADRIDSLTKTILPLIPNPNSAGTVFGEVSNMNPVIQSEPLITRAWGVSLNHALTPSQNLSFTWWRNYFSTVLLEAAPIVPATSELSAIQPGNDLSNVWLVNYEKTVTPRLVATAGVAVEKKTQDYHNNLQNVSFPGVANGTTFPTITFDGQNAPTSYGLNNSSLIHYAVDNVGYNVFNNWLWTKGRHTLNFGGEFHHYYQLTLSNYSGGQFNFSQAQTSTPDPSDSNFKTYGSSFASFLLGDVSSATRSTTTTAAYNTVDLSPYLQDDIKVTPRLTINLGLRWDIMAPYMLSLNQNGFLNPTAPNPAAGGLPGAATELGHCADCAGYERFPIHWRDIGPHIGFAYSIDDKTVIQGGYYITYLGYGGAYGQGEGLSTPVTLSQLLSGEYQQNATGSNIGGYGNWSMGPNSPLPKPAPTPFSASLGTGLTINYVNPKTSGQAPHYQAWSLNLQRQLPWGMFVSAAYSGNRVTHLSGYSINPISQPDPSVLQYGSLLTANINSTAAQTAGFQAPYPAFSTQFGGGATVFQALKSFPQYSSVGQPFDMAGTTFYNALQIQAEKRASNSLTYLASLTLPSLFDNLTTPLNKYNQAPEYAQDSDSYEIKFATTYLLPVGVGQRWLNSGISSRLLGGWKLAGILTYNNAGPIHVTQDGQGLNGKDRPNVVPRVKMSSGGYDKVKDYFVGKLATAPNVFTTNAFANTGSQFVLGDSKRTYSSLRGPFYPAENLSAQKLFSVKESVQFSVRMDFFNALNRHQWAYPNTDISSPSFGKVLSKAGGGNRQGQISASVRF